MSRLVCAVFALTLSGCFLFSSSDNTTGDDTPVACTVAADCTNGEVCAAGRCVAEGSIGIGGMCSANRDCATGNFCTLQGVCAPAGQGGVGTACASGADCAKDLDCQLYGFGGTCEMAGTGDVGDACTATTDCLAGLSCGANNTCTRTVDAFPPFTGVACQPDSAPFKVFFEVPRPGMTIPDFFRLPFPNDARINADGTLNLTDFPHPGPSVILGTDIVGLYADTLSQDFDGFSTVADIYFRFSKAMDFSTAGSNGENVHFVDITSPGQSGFGDDRGRAFSLDGASLYNCQNIFKVATNRNTPLTPGHKYAVYLGSMIRSAAGEAPVQDDDLAAVLGATQPTDPTLAQVWTEYANFRAYLTANSMTPADIAGATVFTVQDTSKHMLALDAAVESSPLPQLSQLTLCDGQTASPCEISGDPVRVCGDSSGSFYEIHGRVTIPNFQEGTLPYEFPEDGGDIVYDSNGVPQVQNTLNVCFALTIPKSAMPSGGWPLLVHAHGTGGSFKDAVDTGMAESLASASVPIATLTYEGVASGERRGNSTRSSDGLMFNVVNPRAARDNNLQGAVDVIQTLRVAQVAPFSVGSVNVQFDPTKVYYSGHSQGSNVGIPAIAVTGLTHTVIFSGAGSYLTEGIMSKTSPVDAKGALSAVVGETLNDGHPVMTIWQTFFDSIDPLNYDAMILAAPPPGVPSKNVYMSWGQGDTYSPDKTLQLTAQVMHLQLVSGGFETVSGLQTVNRPVSGNKVGGDGQTRTAATFQYVTDGTYDGHFVSYQNPMSVADWLAFLTSAATSGTPAVP